jgi:hypothetical protein
MRCRRIRIKNVVAQLRNSFAGFLGNLVGARNGYTSAERVVEMAALRCAELTLQHGYRYFVMTGASDVSRQFSFTTPGYASSNVSGYVSSWGTFSGDATTTITPPQTHNIYKPALMVAIKMGNDENALLPFGIVVGGQKTRPKNAAFLSQSLRQYLGVKQPWAPSASANDSVSFPACG